MKMTLLSLILSLGLLSLSEASLADETHTCWLDSNCTGTIVNYSNKHQCTERGGKSWKKAANTPCRNL